MTTRTEKLDIAAISGYSLASLQQQVRDRAAELALKYRLARERRQLAAMSDDMLRDIGISRADADAESASSRIPAARLHLQVS